MLKGIDTPSSSEYALSIGYQNYQEQITPPPLQRLWFPGISCETALVKTMACHQTML